MEFSKTVAIHQPNFIPWIGYFYKVVKSDAFVILDDVQYTKNSFINRNRIKTAQGELWATLPVKMSGKFGQSIIEARIHNKTENVTKLLKTIEGSYKKADYFDDYFKQFRDLMENTGDNLLDVNMELLSWLFKILDIRVPVVRSSQMDCADIRSTERLVMICKKLNASAYLSGFGGVKYQEEEVFGQNNIKLLTTDFKHPVYKQLWSDFIPNMSILDLLFNCGPASVGLLKNSR